MPGSVPGFFLGVIPGQPVRAEPGIPKLFAQNFEIPGSPLRGARNDVRIWHVPLTHSMMNVIRSRRDAHGRSG